MFIFKFLLEYGMERILIEFVFLMSDDKFVNLVYNQLRFIYKDLVFGINIVWDLCGFCF